jgi:hypothetical protein
MHPTTWQSVTTVSLAPAIEAAAQDLARREGTAIPASLNPIEWLKERLAKLTVLLGKTILRVATRQEWEAYCRKRMAEAVRHTRLDSHTTPADIRGRMEAFKAFDRFLHEHSTVQVYQVVLSEGRDAVYAAYVMPSQAIICFTIDLDNAVYVLKSKDDITLKKVDILKQGRGTRIWRAGKDWQQKVLQAAKHPILSR